MLVVQSCFVELVKGAVLALVSPESFSYHCTVTAADHTAQLFAA